MPTERHQHLELEPTRCERDHLTCSFVWYRGDEEIERVYDKELINTKHHAKAQQ